MAADQKLSVRVLTPEGEVYRGEAVQISTKTVVGEIGVLARHVPILARLRPCELRIHVSEGEIERYAQAEGWMQVFANRATVLVQEAIPPDRLDASQLKERISDAEQRLKESDEDSAAYQQAERDKERAEAFLAVHENE